MTMRFYFYFGTHQVLKYVSGIYIMFCTFVVIWTDVIMLWRPYIPSHTHLKKTLYMDVARNSPTRILVTVVNLCALVVSQIDSTEYPYFVLY